jgi:hypothetical protein
VVNEGEIKAALGGYIALLAPEVRNQGAVIAHMGTVALAAGEAVELKFDTNNRLTSIRVEPSQIAALVENRHAVQAPGGLIIISAQSLDRLVGGVVKNSGAISATGLVSDGGTWVVRPSASGRGKVNIQFDKDGLVLLGLDSSGALKAVPVWGSDLSKSGTDWEFEFMPNGFVRMKNAQAGTVLTGVNSGGLGTAQLAAADAGNALQLWRLSN